jgi:hypothetical protein
MKEKGKIGSEKYQCDQIGLGYYHTWAAEFFQGGGVKFVNPIFNRQFFSKNKKK